MASTTQHISWLTDPLAPYMTGGVLNPPAAASWWDKCVDVFVCVASPHLISSLVAGDDDGGRGLTMCVRVVGSGRTGLIITSHFTTRVLARPAPAPATLKLIRNTWTVWTETKIEEREGGREGVLS